MAQSVLELFRTVDARRGAIGENFLQAGRAVGDPPERKRIEPEELEGDIPPDRLAVLNHRHGEVRHVLLDTEGDVAASGVAVREVAVFVREHRAKGRSGESVEQPYADDQNPFAASLGSL